MSEYYILEQETQRADMPIIQHAPEGVDVLEFYSGGIKSNVKTPVAIEVAVKDQVVFPDVFTYLLPLFSDRLRTFLDQFGIDNIEYYEVEMIDHDTKHKIPVKYWLANIVGLIDCVDREQSDCEYDSFLESYDLNSFVIDPVKAFGAKIFRIIDERSLIIIDESVMCAVEPESFEAIRIRNTRNYDGF